MLQGKVFPYKIYYPNQKEMIEFISKNASLKINAVVESPTGSGKTVAVLSALLPTAKKENKKIIYLCRTHEQCDRVIEELKAINKISQTSGISLKSRKEHCLHDFVLKNTRNLEESMFACSVLKREGKCRYYKNFKPGAFELGAPLTAGEIRKKCESFELCPYEVSKDILKKCDVIACSYLYIFEPNIRNQFLASLEEDISNLIIVLDEAHNLPKLGIELESSVLKETTIENAIREAEESKLSYIQDFLINLHEFLQQARAKEKRVDKEILSKFIEKVFSDKSFSIVEDMLSAGEEIRKEKIKRGKRPFSFVFIVANFLSFWLTRESGGFAFFLTEDEKKRAGFEVLSLDPKKVTEGILNKAFLCTAVSGTLTPIPAFCEIIGLKNYASTSFPSPFPEENIVALADPEVTTLGSMRGEEMYKKIADKISKISKIVPGNLIVFFPSYVVLDAVLKGGIETKKELFIEKSTMSSKENNEMVKRFKASRNGILLGVQQGRNSEGQDFPGEEANGVVLVGIPYAVKGPKIEAQIAYYNELYKNAGWETYSIGEYYGYFLPAYRALNQAAGRAHRTLSDKAAIIFLDRRAAFDRKVRINISPWIKQNMRISENLEKELREFYRV